jgi:RNA polymerase sigma-70 factor (ECF subfamily)
MKQHEQNDPNGFPDDSDPGSEEMKVEIEFAELLRHAKDGSGEAIDELAAGCRDYLLLIANQEMDGALRRKFGASDIVQNSMLAIHKNVSEFRGTQSRQFLAWARKILLQDLNRARREFRDTEKRNLNRERSLGEDSQGISFQPQVVDPNPTPQTNAVNLEESALLETALARLPAEYQQVIRMRNSDCLSFAAIGKRMERSDDAAQKLWARAIEQLKSELRSLNALQ